MKTNPLVSIITPYYDAPEYFSQALRTVADQSYTNYELIIVDDASPDPPAEEIAGEFTFPRLKIIRHEHNHGTQTARNTAVKNSSGSLILPFDCDDMLHPEYLSTAVEAMKDPA